MKIKIENPVNLVLAILVFVIALVIFNQNRKNSKMVETRIDTLSVRIQRMNVLTKTVIDNLHNTIDLISTVSQNLESSSKQLEDLLQKAGSISSSEKQKIRAALDDIKNTRESVEQERQKAVQLIRELNATGNDQN